MKELYGDETILHLESQDRILNHFNIKYFNCLGSNSYSEEQNLLDIAAHTAFFLAENDNYPNFFSSLLNRLSFLATPTNQNEQVQNFFINELKSKARNVYEQANRILACQKNPPKEEIKKIAKSLVYAIAILQDPTNPEIICKLLNNASQTVGASNGSEKFFGALSALAFVAMIIFGFVAIPWTGGTSIPLGYAIAGSLLSGAGAASLFFHGRQKSLAKAQHELANTALKYQKSINKK